MKNIYLLLILPLVLIIAGFIYIKNKPAGTPLAEITLTPAEPSTAFPNAAISNYKFSNNGDSVKFEYELKNYILGSQTADASSKVCANSAKGQHIHLILNNMPYEAWYIPSFKKKLSDGHYVALSFLSRSYHESIKTKDAYVLKQFNIGKNAYTEEGNIDLKKPLLFYSRPKGEYVGNDTKKVLLDFYLVNTNLNKNGNKVKATINGKEFIIDEWKPFYIEGLPMGESIVKLELLDKNNKPLGQNKMFQAIERKIVLKEN
jgi:hypothetical protein